MARRIEELIRNLDLREHPEGGFYRRTYRSPHMLP
ncbi:MAG: cupin domain-containing protein, partial [Deltaproteobacteria bacterium]|nr:cupin domain-containing protein [Deltaproteobacteria bacterium]